MKTRFKIIVPSFNSVHYLPKTLASIESQDYENFEVCVVDDASTLPAQREIIADYCSRNGWKAIYHKENTGALYSLIDGIRALAPDDEDVIIVVDGDDWLAHDQVLQRLHHYYSSEDLAITWGQYQEHPRGWLPVRYAAPIDADTLEKNAFRDLPWIFWHPHTFKYWLWKGIKDKDFKDRHGEYLRVSGDQAFMLPMLEMAGPRGKFIDELLYIYNIDNPLNDFKINRPEQAEATAYIRSLPRYHVRTKNPA